MGQHRRKKILIGLGILLFAFISVIYYIVNQRAESYLQQFVESQSNGKISFHVKKVRLGLFQLKFNFIEPEFWTHDSSKTVTGYHIKAESISFQVKALVPIMFGKQVVIDSVMVRLPEIDVFKYQQDSIPSKKISIPEEMGKVYQSLEKVLGVMYLDYLFIDQARFSVFDRTKPDSAPLVVSRLNLTVNHVNDTSGPSGRRFLFADRIVVEIFNQDILLPDGSHGIKFKRFRLSTGSQTIKLDSCTFYGKKNDLVKGEFSSFIDSVRISKMDFNALVGHQIIKLDSAICYQPNLHFELPLPEKSMKGDNLQDAILHKDSLDFMLKKILGNLDLGYLAVKNAKVEIITLKGLKKNVFNLDKSNFSMEKLLVNNDPKIPLRLDRFNLQLHNYLGYSADSMYVVSFDEIQVLDRNISLLNFRIGPSSKNHEALTREMKMEAFGFNNINWPILLYENRIVAGRVVLKRPELNFKLPDAKLKRTSDNTIQFEAIRNFRKKIEVEGISIEDATVRVDLANGTHFTIDHLFTGIGVNKLLQSTSLFSAIHALDTLSFSSGEFRNQALRLKMINGSYSGKTAGLKIGQIVQTKLDKSLMLKLNDIALSGINIKSADTISVSGLSWAKAEFSLESVMAPKSQPGTTAPAKGPTLLLGKLAGGPTQLNFKSKNFELSTRVNKIESDIVRLRAGEQPRINGLMVDGHSLNLMQRKLSGKLSEFVIADNHPSELNNVEIKLPINGEMATFFVPKMLFSVNITRSMEGDLMADYIEMQHPEISFQKNTQQQDEAIVNSGGKAPSVHINRLVIDQPKLLSPPAEIAAKMKFDPGKSTWKFLGIRSDKAGFQMDSLRITLSQPYFGNEKIQLLPTGKEYIKLSASAISMHPGVAGKKSDWALNLDSFESLGLNLNLMNKDTVKQNIAVRSFKLSNLALNSEMTDDLAGFLGRKGHFRLSNGNIAIDNGKSRIETFNLAADQAAGMIGLDSLAFYPLVDRDAFMQEKEYRTGYMQIYTKSLRMNGFDFELLLKDKSINARKVQVNELHFLSYVDKRLLIRHGVEKPMLTELLTKLKTSISVDSLLIKNSLIESEEISDKTLQLGKVTLNDIRGIITGIRNYQFSPTDSLKFNLFTKLMNVAEIRVKYSQSYTDSLSSFNLKAIVSPFDLTALNSFLRPLASAQVNSGYLDTLRMSVVGRKHVAFGIMKMYYHDLSVEYLNKGAADHSTFFTRLVSFFANRIVHNKNQSGTGAVYAERDPEKGFVNYWVKIFIGGVFSNTGIRTDKKQERKYYQSVKKYKVPPIPNIPVDY
jgi:hypothetical protein